MSGFPRTMVGGVSVSRMIVGTNWFLGFTHTTAAKDDYIAKNVQDRKKIADILEVFFRNGIDTVMGLIQRPALAEGVKEAEDRTGVKAVVISTPAFKVDGKVVAEGIDVEDAARTLDTEAALGARILMPHQSTTDVLCDRATRKIRRMDQLCAMIRERGMVPGLSTHMPEVITYADESGLDVESYISIYNLMGFLMQIEVDWVQRIIQGAKKPVMTIKPMAAGQVRPFQGLTFAWNTIRAQDMVTVGTMSPREAEEVIEISRGALERRMAEVKLQETRSKASVKGIK